jgi:hypothetical protein
MTGLTGELVPVMTGHPVMTGTSSPVKTGTGAPLPKVAIHSDTHDRVERISLSRHMSQRSLLFHVIEDEILC